MESHRVANPVPECGYKTNRKPGLFGPILYWGVSPLAKPSYLLRGIEFSWIRNVF
jgi:hypothetical protein